MKTVLVLAWRAVLFELGLYRSLLRWIARRPAVPAGTTPFRYVGAVTALLWVFIVVSAIEMVVLHLALPWEPVRLAADILSAWGLVWMLGLLASFNVYPHVVGDSGLRLRNGVSTDFTVPWDAIATIDVRERGREKSRAVQIDRDEAGAVVNVVVASRTNVDVTLRRPLTVPVRRTQETVTAVRFFADDARELVARARKHLPVEAQVRR